MNNELERSAILNQRVSRRGFLRMLGGTGAAAVLAACGGEPQAAEPTATPARPATSTTIADAQHDGQVIQLGEVPTTTPSEVVVVAPPAEVTNTTAPTDVPTAEATVTPTEAPTGTVVVEATATSSPETSASTLPLIKAEGMKLMTDTGEVRGIGINRYDLIPAGTCQSPFNEKTREQLFSEMSKLEVKVIRFWLFRKPGTDEADFSQMDKLVELAHKYTIYLMPTLDDHWNHCTGFDKNDDFYGNENNEERKLQLSFVKKVAERYAKESAIGCWDLVNEPEGDHTALKEYVADNTKILKEAGVMQIDTVGAIGTGQSGAEGPDNYADLFSALSTLSFHDYNKLKDPLPGDQWNGLQTRLNTAAGKIGNAGEKPIIVGEAGIKEAKTEADCNGDSECTTPEQRALDFKAKIDAFFKGTGNSGLYLIWSGPDPYQLNNERGDSYGFTLDDPLAKLIKEINASLK